MGNGLLGVLLVSVLFLATSGYPFHHLTRSRRSRRMPDMQIYKSREMLTRGRRAGVQNRRDISYLSHNPFQPGPAQQAYGFLNPDRTIRTPQSQQMQHVLPPLQPHQPVVQPLLHSVGSHQQGSLPLDGDPGTEQKFQPGLQPNDFPPRHEASNMDVGLSNTEPAHSALVHPVLESDDSTANDPNVPCDKTKCVEPTNCINVTQEESDCCSKCVQRGCQCEGYQLYDCMQNGYEKGRVPEGQSYSVDSGSTTCSCPVGGGVITCSYQDTFGGNTAFLPPNQPKFICPDSPRTCIDSYIRQDGCEECTAIGCVAEDGTKHLAGSSFEKQPCSTCYCPPEGGTPYCSLDQACMENSNQNPPQTSQALEATQRVLRDPIQSEGQTDEQTPNFGQYGKSMNLGSDGRPEVGYDTRYLQSDWNKFTSQSNSYQPALSDGSTKTSKDREDTVVPPLVNPDAASSASSNGASVDAENQLKNGYNSFRNQPGYLRPGDQSGGVNGFNGYGYGGYGGYQYQPQQYLPYPYGYPGYGSQEQPAVPDSGDAVSGGRNSEQAAAGSVPFSGSQGTYQGQTGGYYGSRFPNFYGGLGNGNQPKDSSRDDAGVGTGSDEESNIGQDSSQSHGVANNLAVALGTKKQNAKIQGTSSAAAVEGNDESQISDDVQPADHGDLGSYGNIFSNYQPPGYGLNYRGQSIQSAQNMGLAGDDQSQGAIRYVPSYGQNVVPEKQAERSAGAAVRSKENSGRDAGQPLGSIQTLGLASNSLTSAGGQEASDGLAKAAVAPEDPAVDSLRKSTSPGSYSAEPSGNLPKVESGIPSHSDLQHGQPFWPTGINKNFVYGNSYYNYHQTLQQPYENSQVQQGYNNQYPLQSNSFSNPAGSSKAHGPIDNQHLQQSSGYSNGHGQQPPSIGPQTPLFLNGQHLPSNESVGGYKASENNVQNSRVTAGGVESTRATFTHAPVQLDARQPQHQEESNISAIHFENVLSRCCVRGKQWALNHDSCSGIQVTEDSYSQICAVAQEKCCMEARNQENCLLGVRTARSMAACEAPGHLDQQCDRNGFKTCCQCCALGLKAYSVSLNCTATVFGGTCGKAYTECCQKGRMMPSDHPLPQEPDLSRNVNQPTETEQSSQRSNVLRCVTDNHCSHICADTATGIECQCEDGWSLEDDDRTCTDVNECVLNLHTCTEGQACINNEGSYECVRLISCGTGYELTKDNTCRDIDECDLNLHNCGEHLDCLNVRGSFRCIAKSCDVGYITDATGGCIDIDECRSGDYSCPPLSRCENTVGSYSCRCPDGLAFDSSRQTCEDIDECDLGVSTCLVGSTCINTEGSFTCIDPPRLTCSAGYVPNQAKTECVDVDECAEGSHTCAEGSTCINEDGGFRCQDPIQCEPGFRPSANQRSCIDIDECSDSGTNRCGAGGRCVNLPGSYRCDCKRGYRMGNETVGPNTCEDIDECNEAAGSQCLYRCENSLGSYSCVCPDGYTIKRFGRACQDIDECAQQTDNCSASETCFNTRGGFKCVDIECPENYAKLSSRRKSVLKCWYANVHDSIRSPNKVKVYTYLHVYLPSIPTLEKPELLLKLRKGATTDYFNVNIKSGNEANKFELKQLVSYATLSLIAPVEGPWETILRIEANTQTNQWKKIIVVYVYVSEYNF